MPRPDLLPASMAPESRRALKYSLLLHVGILVLAILLPYLQRPPVIEPPRVVEAVLVSAASISRPVPVKPPPAPEPAPEPAPVATPEPVVAAKPVEPVIKPVEKPIPATVPKVALPQAKPVEPVPPKPVPPRKPLASPAMNKNALDAEMKALEREMKAQQIKADADRAQRDAANAATSARDAANLALREKHERLIRQRVITKWNRPLSAKRGMVATLRINVLPGGEVSNVVTVKSSGDTAFDASAEDAVRRSSPLPVPDDIAVFNTYFRVITFKFSPEDM